MLNKFHCWRLFCQGCAVVVVCLLGSNTASQELDDICDDDEAIGLCLYEGYFFKIRSTLTPAQDISCQWVWAEGELRFVCEPRFYLEPGYSFTYHPYTFMVHAETRAQRQGRIVFTVDRWIVNTVKRWKNECDSFLKGGPAVLGYDHSQPRSFYEFTEKDCKDIIKVYDAGFTDPVYGGSYLTGFEVIDEPATNWFGRFNPVATGTGKIVVNMGKIEDFYGVYGAGQRALRQTVAHERIHLADWADNSYFDWIEKDGTGKPSREWHRLYKNDETYMWARFIGDKAGPIDPELVWDRMCLNDHVHYYLAGWGHKEIRDGYCFVKIERVGKGRR